MRTGTSLKSVALLTFIFVAAVAAICISVSDGSVAAADGSSDYYKEQLSGKEKEVYNIIYPVAFALDSGYTTVAFTAADFSDEKLPTVDEGQKAFYALYYDHPEMFWMTSEIHSTYNEQNRMTSIELTPSDTGENISVQKSQLALAEAKVKVEGEFTYDKVKQIHDWIVDNTAYDTEAVGIDKPIAHSICGVFVEKKCVCEGYAKAFMYLCQKNGIDCIVSIGQGVSDKSSENHMWNYIRMEDGKWYCMDVTWDDPLVDGKDSGRVYYNYFLKGTESVHSDKKFTESHVDTMAEDHSLNKPELSAEAYRFHPGDTEFLDAILSNKDEAGNITATYTLLADAIDDVREYIGTGGSARIQAGGFQFTISCEDLKKVKEKLTADSVTEVTFGGTAETKSMKMFTQYGFLESIGPIYDYEKEVTVYAPSISTGDISSLGLSEMKIGIVADMKQLDLNMFMRVWDYSAEDGPVPIKAEYDGTYENFTAESLGTYCAGNNPVSPALNDLPFILVILILVLVVLFIIILIRLLLKHRKIKRMARTMAKSKRNMQHYKQLYEDRELSSDERKAFLKAVKIYNKNKGKEES